LWVATLVEGHRDKRAGLALVCSTLLREAEADRDM